MLIAHLLGVGGHCRVDGPYAGHTFGVEEAP